LPVTTMYERLGGMPFFEALTDEFYRRVAQDEILRPLYPEDLAPARLHLQLFLAQFWGGPRLYDEQRGNPHLRVRHLAFRIGPAERDRWLELMGAALEASHARAMDKAQLLSYFESVASHLVNC